MAKSVELFGNNVAYEIRLQQALEEDMLCPFHYYGVGEYIKEAPDGKFMGQQVSADSMTDSPAPSVAYATVYPIAMVFLILFIQMIANLIV